MRIALGIEYDGTSYNGWQRQKTGIGVQQRLGLGAVHRVLKEFEVTQAVHLDLLIQRHA